MHSLGAAASCGPNEKEKRELFLKLPSGHFPDDPVFKTLCSQCRGTGLTLAGGARSNTAHSLT